MHQPHYEASVRPCLGDAIGNETSASVE
ncbi:hypothetical protein F383_21190 [Gossypium arboreum]|uniref:Uncharacterized protein n=1 Tax=Gossypium arboreum TaxID=29729 RepID=A0A0B0NSA6_GOSAR|nr:hypothetical protein F383_21190 [Gossypium arboreum]